MTRGYLWPVSYPLFWRIKLAILQHFLHCFTNFCELISWIYVHGISSVEYVVGNGNKNIQSGHGPSVRELEIYPLRPYWSDLLAAFSYLLQNLTAGAQKLQDKDIFGAP